MSRADPDLLALVGISVISFLAAVYLLVFCPFSEEVALRIIQLP
jgi:hypothetical protein